MYFLLYSNILKEICRTVEKTVKKYCCVNFRIIKSCEIAPSADINKKSVAMIYCKKEKQKKKCVTYILFSEIYDNSCKFKF